jgi:Hypothetical protein (DUF2513)
MKPDPEYTRKLLEAFRDAPDPTTDINELKERGLSHETAEFYFHLRLLDDDGFVARDDGEPGIGAAGSGGHHSWPVVPLRLTASGHEFAEAMENKTAFAAVKKSFASSSLSVMRDIAVSVLKAELAKHGFGIGT